MCAMGPFVTSGLLAPDHRACRSGRQEPHTGCSRGSDDRLTVRGPDAEAIDHYGIATDTNAAELTPSATTPPATSICPTLPAISTVITSVVGRPDVAAGLDAQHDGLTLQDARLRLQRRAGCQLPRLRQPSTTMRWPVMKPAPSEARKLTAWAMSAGVPIRPAGTEAR